jgi:heterodisulfide reductase subunit D
MEMTAKNIATVGNITGDKRENRLLWFENMPAGSVKVGGKAEYLYFAGCVPTLYPSSYTIPQSFAGLLNKAKIDWNVLGAEENCCAYPLVMGGMKEQAVKTIQENVKNVKATGAKYLVTTCPSCYNAWKEVYPALVSDMPELKIMHASQLLTELNEKGVLKFKESPGTVTYHDPCDLGRKSNVYEEPRNLIKAIPGVKFVEMKFNKTTAFCCGGGGNLEMNDADLSGKVAQHRIQQALDTGADTIVTACQQCKRTLAGGAKAMRAKIKVMELSEFIMSTVE